MQHLNDVCSSQIALFSAIVTSFLVQSLSGLTQDAGIRTNELLSNLTEVVIALGAGTPASELSLPHLPDSSRTEVRFD